MQHLRFQGKLPSVTHLVKMRVVFADAITIFLILIDDLMTASLM